MSTTTGQPFHLDAQGGVAFVADPDRALVDRVTALVGTVPGERVMRCDYGVPTPSLLFDSTRDIMLYEVKRQCTLAINRWEPAAVIVQINPVVDPDLGTCRFDLRVGRGDMPNNEAGNTRRVRVRVGGQVQDL